MTPKENLLKFGLKLPNITNPGGSYLSVNVRNNIAFVAIQFPILNEAYLYQGRLGNEILTDQGYKAAELCGLNVLAHLENKVGLDNLIGLNHIEIFFQSSDNWDDSPIVANGASDLFNNILETKGEHTRSIIGVHKLPRNFCVGLSASFTI